MAKIRSLSKSAVIDLQRMNDRLRSLEQSIEIGRRGYRESRAHYLVKTPTAGIPALASITPGSAICTIVKRMASGIVDTGRSQKVYNLGGKVLGGQIIIVHRDAFGDLWVTDDGSCEDLDTGSYAATVGGAIAGGASGPVVYDGTVYTAKNQSACNVVIGDLIILHVTASCELLFTPCVCDCAQTTPETCCDKFIAICINNEVKIIAVNGGTAQWDLSGCCECDSTPTLEITLTCVTTTITADWEYQCGATVVTGSLDYSGLCDDPVEEPVDTITPDGCSIVISASIEAEQCLPCEPPPVVECCECTGAGVQSDDDGGNPLGVSFTTFPNNLCIGQSHTLVFQDVDQGADTLIQGQFPNGLVNITNSGGGTLTGGDGTTNSFSIDFGASAARTLTIAFTLMAGGAFNPPSTCISGEVVGGIFANDGRTRIDWPSDPC